MGAEFNYEKLVAQNEEEAVAEVKEMISQALYDSGHGGYTGTLAEANGVTVEHPLGVQPDDAEEWLSDQCEKWGPAVVIKDASGGFHVGAVCSS